MRWQSIWPITREAIKEFSADNALGESAALAFYSALGLAPAILLFLAVTAYLGESTKQKLVEQMEALVGRQAAEVIQLVVKSAEQHPVAGTWSAVAGGLTLLFSASGIFAQLQSGLNHIWNVKPRPSTDYWGWVRSRLLSAGLLMSVLFLLLVSLVVSTAIAFVLPTTGAGWELITNLISLAIFTLLFAAIFKFLPDVKIAWRNVWIGATVTAVLFALGKHLIGVYLGQSSVTSSYGAAGSLIALLVWVYYSAAIVYFGAEFTQVVARHSGSIQPADHATPAVAGKDEKAVTAATKTQPHSI